MPQIHNPNVTVREVHAEDARALAVLLNAIIAKGGTTALQTPYTAEQLDEAYLTGPKVICCFVAVGKDGQIEGFQTLGRYPGLPDDVGDIGTFTRIDAKQQGVGSTLFIATRARATELGLSALSATIRADNVGGLAFYTKLGFTDHNINHAVPLGDGTLADRISKRFSLEGSVG